EVPHRRDRRPPRARRLHPPQLPLARRRRGAGPLRHGPRRRIPRHAGSVSSPPVLVLRLQRRGGEHTLRGQGARHGAAGQGDGDDRGHVPARQGLRDRRLGRPRRVARRGYRGRAAQDPGQRARRPRHLPRRLPRLPRRRDRRRRRRLPRRGRRHHGRVAGHPRHRARRRPQPPGVPGRLRLRPERHAGRRQGRCRIGGTEAALRGGADGLRQRVLQRLRRAGRRRIRPLVRGGPGLPGRGPGVV
ncbi:MAG: Dihydroorotate dehydrogenase (NAD(+)), electron transfer subunit, partial [uncultured Rubrobacteraceae bacterium]